jgi:hypothetical protein
MKRVLLVLFVMVVGCTRERPPPKMCEVPPPQKKDVFVGTCPIDWGPVGGTVAADAVVADAPPTG